LVFLDNANSLFALEGFPQLCFFLVVQDGRAVNFLVLIFSLAQVIDNMFEVFIA
jgi:hypothetical protein